MTDRELLEMAAKAAGIEFEGDADKLCVFPGHYSDGFSIYNDKGGSNLWNPFADDGDALRLADLLEPCCLTIGDAQQAVAAAELRRLHEENTMLSNIARQYEELRRVIDDGSESMTHEDAVEDVKVFHRMYEQNIELKKINAQLLAALELAEAGLADIGDADREPGDDLEWCERRAAKPLPVIRAAIKAAKGEA